jgi:hypothetical protein
MTSTDLQQRRWYGAFVPYGPFLNNDPHYFPRTKWNRFIRAGRVKCRPFSLRQEEFSLYVVHDSESELLATRMAVDHTPLGCPPYHRWVDDFRERALAISEA